MHVPTQLPVKTHQSLIQPLKENGLTYQPWQLPQQQQCQIQPLCNKSFGHIGTVSVMDNGVAHVSNQPLGMYHGLERSGCSSDADKLVRMEVPIDADDDSIWVISTYARISRYTKN